MRRLLTAVVVSALAAGVALTHAQVRELRHDFPPDQDLYYLPSTRHLELASLGYREVLADLVWIRALLLVADIERGQQHQWIVRYIDAITTLSPGFRRAYLWGGVVFVYTGQAIERGMLDRALEIYRKGLDQFPEDHELLFATGMIMLRDVRAERGYDDEEIAAARREGATLLRRAAAFGAPPVVRQYAATFIDEAVEQELALQFLESQYLETDDDGLRRLLEVKIEALAEEGHLDTLAALRQAFLEERDHTLPYLPETTYAIIRPEPHEDLP